MYTPFKMKGKSPMMKKLVGNQHRLPEHLKAKIEAAPESPTKMKKESATKMKKASMTKMKKESMAKLKKSATKMKKSMAKKKINPFSAEYKKMTVSQRKKKYGDDYKSRLQGSGKKAITRENIGKAIEKTKGKINKLNEKVQKGADKLSKDLKKTKEIKIAEKLGLNYKIYKLSKKKNKSTSTKSTKKNTGKIDWKTAPAVGSKARTEWYKKHNLKLDDTTPALMKKSAAKMKKSSMKLKKSAAKLKKKTKDGLKEAVKGTVKGGLAKGTLKVGKEIDKDTGTSMRGVKKGSLKNVTKDGITPRELRIKRNKEFLPIAIKRGLAPKSPKAGDLSAKGRAELKAYEKFYSNKDNIKKLRKAQDEYFKNKK